MRWFALVLLFCTSSAHAVTCDEIVTMIDKGVPTDIVVSTMEGSGRAYTRKDVDCLTAADAPDAIVQAAEQLGAAPQTVASRDVSEAPGRGWGREILGLLLLLATAGSMALLFVANRDPAPRSEIGKQP